MAYVLDHESGGWTEKETLTASDAAPGILRQFTLTRTDGEIVIRDADGTLYRGPVLSGQKNKRDSADAAPDIPFRATGRSARLQRDVVIEGSLLELEPRIDSYEESLEFCLQKLPERSRRMLELRYTCAMSADEIASQLKMTVQSVYTRLSQIRVALRDCVRRQLRRSGGSAP